MANLNQDLEILRELNNHRDRARKLREQGLQPLKSIKDIEANPPKFPFTKIFQQEEKREFDFGKWVSSGNNVEISLLVKVQNHQDICEKEDDNNLSQATSDLKTRLSHIKLKDDLMPSNLEEPNDIDSVKSVPVITAARTMQVLTSRSETVISRATIVCYYRILRELYGAAPPDWTVGAARAGIGGTTSAFVTGECIRAIFSFRNSFTRTATFFRSTKELLENYSHLRAMIRSLGDTPKDHPLHKWADRMMESMFLDWYLTTNLRRGQVALFCNKDISNNLQKMEKIRDISDELDKVSDNAKNELFFIKPNEGNSEKTWNIEAVSEYFDSLAENLEISIDLTTKKIKKAQKEISEYREDIEEVYTIENGKRVIRKDVKDFQIRRFLRSESAHLFAMRVIEDALIQIEDAKLNVTKSKEEFIKEQEKLNKEKEEETETEKQKAVESRLEDLKIKYLTEILSRLAKQSDDIALNINRVIAPTKQYIKTVLRRELSASPSTFDAGELVFAATTFGTIINWQQHELLDRACGLLEKSLPESGRLFTKRPLHTSNRGYRLLPIGCEMTRSLAQLFEKTNYDINPQLVSRMLNIFEEKLLYLDESDDKTDFVGWNFDSSPNSNKPCVWVSAVSVLGLDRIVRMLNSKINNMILKHFEVITPDNPHIEKPINGLIYSDYGFDEYYFKKHKKEYEDLKPIPIQLELMRAHIMRVCLPRFYSGTANKKIYSSILYGPPGTGKTTLAEVLALSAEKPLIKLSPSDLIVQGDSLIEGRAHDIFEALSMLTQVIIIFDEFEPILKSRKSVGMREEDPKFRFLLGGMLPKLLKLNDTAKKHSLIYFLGTNVLKDIDEAATRSGRFDLKVPIYNPCPLSRAGAFLYELSKAVRNGEQLKLHKDAEQLLRFLQIIVHTSNEKASELAQNYFNKKKSKYFEYVFGNTETYSSIELKTEEKLKKLEEKIKELKSQNILEKIEEMEYEWLFKFEERFAQKIEELNEKINQKKPVNLVEFLTDSLKV